MADNSILTPGYGDNINTPITPQEPNQYLITDNFLSEYSTEEEKSIVRENLGVISKDSVYTKQDINIIVSERIRDAIQEYLNMEDPHGILPTVEEMIEGMVKVDGSTPFISPQAGVDPQSDNHLTTKKFVTRLLKEHVNAEDPHNILPEVQAILEKYVKTSDIYYKSQLYTKQEINKQLENYLKNDGTSSFTKAQIGVDPIIDSHLATKRYVDKTLYGHLVDIDPHGFLTILNDRLSKYVKKKDVYDKTQTYSRTQIDSIINKLVEQTIDDSIAEYIDQINDKFEYIRKQNYVKQDGSIPFKNPQSGVDAINAQDLITKHQVEEIVENNITNVYEELNSKIDKKECTWITSGPVKVNVGMVEQDSEFAKKVNLQEIMDAIFYGQGIKIEVNPVTKLNDSAEILLCVQGSLATMSSAELYQNGKVILTFTKSDFETNNCITVNSIAITEDTEFIFKVYYVSGSFHEATATTKLAMPIFIGLLPKWQFGNTITYQFLIDQYTKDPINNYFYDEPKTVKNLSHKYSFNNAEQQHIMIALPADYPELEQVSTISQSFGIEAFDIIDMIPWEVPGIEDDVIYKLYIYRQAISSLDTSINIKFKS